jgi:uncharacterized membrane protein YecN with MAPEG domain
MILPITMTLAGAAAILHIWLAMRVSQGRRQFKVSVGDGGNEGLLRRIRAHGNYIETMPLVIILVGLLELAGGDNRILWGAAILYIFARLLHVFGMDGDHRMRLRFIGMVASTLVLLGLAGWSLSYAYRQPPAQAQAPGEIMIGPGRTAAR